MPKFRNADNLYTVPAIMESKWNTHYLLVEWRSIQALLKKLPSFSRIKHIFFNKSAIPILIFYIET